MRLTEPLNHLIRAYTFAVMRARYDYAEHPSEFSKPDYCVKCSELVGTGRCSTCASTRAARGKRKGVAA